MTTHTALRVLESLRPEFDPLSSRAKCRALELLARKHLSSARDVGRLHEAALFARAYPDDAQMLRAASRVLGTFERRADLKRHAGELIDTGIAGTAIRYRFFWPMARWLAARHGDRLTIDWDEGEFAERLRAALPVLVTTAEGEAIGRAELAAREAIDRLRARGETDAAFVLARIGKLPGGDRVRESLHDALDVAYRLAPSATGPSRTHARLDAAPFAFRSAPPDRGRPDLTRALRRPPLTVRPMSAREGSGIVDLAREAMVTRSRDLDAFAHGDGRDVHLIDDGDGLAFALIGVHPERRLFLPAVYGALTLRNGVPIGYVQLDVLFRNAEVSYNTFTTFRGAEAGFVFGRLLAATHHVFGVSSFSVEPYQLGRGNEEGLASGAWWFYAQCGFRPRDPAVLRLARVELARRRREPRYRSGRRSLEKLAEAHVFWPSRPAGNGRIAPTAGVGLAIAHRLARAGDGDREAALTECEESAARRLGVRIPRGWTPDERMWWRRWAPLIDAIPRLQHWPADERAAVARIVRAKGGRRESEFAKAFDAHPRLPAAVLAIARR